MWRWLVWFWAWLLRRPSPFVFFYAEVFSMSSIRLSLVWPTPTVRQRPIAGGLIEMRAQTADNSLPWTEVSRPTPAEVDLVFPDIAPGVWELRGFVVDEGAEASPASVSLADVPFDSPSPFVEFAVTIE